MRGVFKRTRIGCYLRNQDRVSVNIMLCCQLLLQLCFSNNHMHIDFDDAQLKLMIRHQATRMINLPYDHRILYST